MSAVVLRGAAVAAALNEGTAKMVQAMEKAGLKPCLALVRIGQRGDDIAYEKGIIKRCEGLGIALRRLVLDEDCSQSALLDELAKLNGDASVHGILVFMPLPEHISEEVVRKAIAPEKDVDGVTEGSAAAVFTGRGRGFAPCTARAVIEMLKFYSVEMEGKSAAVFGRSLVTGRPVSMLLMAENATVTVCHSRTVKAEEIAKRTDIVVAALGKAKALGCDCFAPGQTVIDVGINFDEDGKMCGDVDFDSAQDTVAAISPVPGGVGAVTTAVLARHVAEAAEKIMMTNFA